MLGAPIGFGGGGFILQLFLLTMVVSVVGGAIRAVAQRNQRGNDDDW